MESRLIQGFETPDDTIYFVREAFKIQSELLDYLTDLDEEDKIHAISELRELEDNIQQINVDIPKEDEALPLGLPLDFGKLLSAFSYSEIEEILNSFHTERDHKIEEFERRKIDESRIDNEIKEYLIAKRKLIQDFQKKLKSIDTLLKKLLSEKYELNAEEKSYINIDSLRILKTITTISLNYEVEKWDSLQRTYSIFRRIHSHFLRLRITDKNILQQVENSSPLFDEIPSDKESFFQKYLKSGLPLIPKKKITTEQILFAIELKFWEYQKKLFELLSIDENVIFKKISLYERIKQRFNDAINGLFIDDVEKVLTKNPILGYSVVVKWRFDFVIHDEFRIVILRDFDELKSVLQAGCYKSALILTGSILEAILFDLFYENDDLIRQKFKQRHSKTEYLYSHTRFKWLTEATKELGIINEDLKRRCEFIWNLRHNVHSMKEIEGLKVTKEDVDAAVALMTKVVQNLNKNVTKYLKAIQDKLPGLDIEFEKIAEVE